MRLFKTLMGMAAAAVLAMAPVAASAQNSLEQIIESGSLRIGVAQSPPWFFKTSSDAEWTGTGVSIGKQMAEDLGVKLEFVETTWGNAVAALQANQMDLMFILDATPQRALAVDFPTAPSIFYAMAVMHNEDFDVSTWEALNNGDVSIAVAQGTAIDSFISRTMPNAEIQRFGGLAEAVAAFQSGRTDLVAMFHPALISFQQKLGRGSITLPTPVFASASSAGVRPMEDKAFRDWVNTALAFYYNTGRTQGWFEEALTTLGVDPKGVPPIQRELWN
ncbi:transporter substrate-binding domain-containing protein [Oricola sp.]|uniref:transporter substrate-binding domain-containing protein n=1 Tax=Oricola sp. TaxID=1979950 RepID=UPI0035122E5D